MTGFFILFALTVAIGIGATIDLLWRPWKEDRWELGRRLENLDYDKRRIAEIAAKTVPGRTFGLPESAREHAGTLRSATQRLLRLSEEMVAAVEQSGDIRMIDAMRSRIESTVIVAREISAVADDGIPKIAAYGRKEIATLHAQVAKLRDDIAAMIARQDGRPRDAAERVASLLAALRADESVFKSADPAAFAERVSCQVQYLGGIAVAADVQYETGARVASAMAVALERVAAARRIYPEAMLMLAELRSRYPDRDYRDVEIGLVHGFPAAAKNVEYHAAAAMTFVSCDLPTVTCALQSAAHAETCISSIEKQLMKVVEDWLAHASPSES